jgi:hypothetical protein
MKNLKEQIDYSGYPERMDPNLERKLSDPEGLYSKNPAMKKGTQDVQRLISSRFKKVVDKLKQVTGIENLSSRQVQGMIFQEMMSKIPQLLQIEARHKDELEQLAVEASLEETETPSDWYVIEPNLNRSPIDVSNFRYQEDPEDEEDQEEDEKENLMIPSFDVEDLTPEEELELEKHKRNIINAIIQGAAKKGHYLFQKPEVKARLDAIDPRLYRDYLGIMAIDDFMYFTMEQMIEMMSQTGQGVAGKVELDSNDDDEGEGGGEETPDTKIKAFGLIFPILTHEIIKGIEEAKGRHGLPQDPEMRRKVLGQTDILSNEPMQLRIGPEIVEQLRFVLPDEMFDTKNKGLIVFFKIELYKMPAEQILGIVGDAISEDSSKVNKAKSKFVEIMNKAKSVKEDFENWKNEKEEENIDSGNDDDDDLDDFLRGLGIERP